MSSSTPSRGALRRRLVELIHAQPANVRDLVMGRLNSAVGNSAAIDEALNNPERFIQRTAQSAGYSLDELAPPPRSPSRWRPVHEQTLTERLESEPQVVRHLALDVLISAEDQPNPTAEESNAIQNPQPFIELMRAIALMDVQPPRAPPDENSVRTSQPRTTRTHTPEGLDPEVFQALPDVIRTEILSSSRPSSQHSPQGTSVDAARPATATSSPAPQPARPEPEAASSSSPSPFSEEREEQISWPQIQKWLQSRTGPKPLVLCVWCQEELVIADGDLQPENGVREPAFHLPCKHLVGGLCFHKSLKLRVRVDCCPYCRADLRVLYG